MSKRAKRKPAKSQEPRDKRDLPHERLVSSRAFGTGDGRNLAIVAGVAVVVRVVFFLLNRANNPLFDHPIMDGLYHHEWAVKILTENFWGNEVFFRAPLYPYFLAGLYKLGGTSIAFALAVQHGIGVCTSVLTYLLARRFFTPRVALLAGVVAALYWPFLYFEGDLLIVTLIVCLDVLALLLLVIGLQREKPWLFAVAGLVIGLSAIARPSILILLPALPIVFYAARPRARSWVGRSLVVYAAAAVVIAPVVVRNYVVGGDIVPIASQGGVNFYIGNNPQSDGRTAIVPGTRWDWWGGYEDALRLAEKEAGRPLKPSEVSGLYFHKGLRFVFGSPDRSLPLFARKLYLFWAGGERSNNKYIYFFWRQSGMGRVPLPGFWLVAPLGLLGAALLWRKRCNLTLLYAFVVSYMIGVVAFFVNARFRLPVVPVLIIFASYGFFYVLAAARTYRSKLPFALIVLVAAFAVIDLDFVTFRENKAYADSISHYTLGNAYLKMGNVNDAIREYETAIQVDARYPTPGYRLIARNVNYNLGKLLHETGECGKGIGYLERVGGQDIYAFRSRLYAADCYVELGRPQDAIRSYTSLAGLTQDPALLGPVYHGLGRAYKAVGNREAALDNLRRARQMMPDDETLEAEIRALEAGG